MLLHKEQSAAEFCFTISRVSKNTVRTHLLCVGPDYGVCILMFVLVYNNQKVLVPFSVFCQNIAHSVL